MRQLRFVRPTEDGSHLVVETADGNEQFCLRNDAQLRDAARADLPRLPTTADPVRPETQIGPRDIQVRVRAGESPQDLADSYGVSLERVLRFAGPVMDERLRIASEARRARARRSTTEGQVVQFGEAVDNRFTAHGITPSDVTWDARRRDDGDWVIVAGWLGGDSRHSAEWLFHRTSRSVTPVDDTAADLLSDRPIRPVTPPPPERPSLVAAPPLAPGIVAFPPMPDAHTGPLPTLEEVFDQDAPPDGPREVPPLVPAGADLEFNSPTLPLAITDPSTRPAAVPGLTSLRNLGTAKRDESDEERAARVRVPSWDDILLGVRRKQD
ncbi:MAG: hypothetical protein JWR06_885 [Jatrophihabitans sp.]|jgi:hypothetical protein|nr:hypothetical protein [Jatrophihabitans sp.]MCW2656692.1 hypothetical protein [Jatrophihabitans sp.]MDT4905341.1 hypothetical protein [Pseudonocardiales bacterium]